MIDESGDDPHYNAQHADWDDDGAASPGRRAGGGLTARAEAAGFSPIRNNKSRPHSLDYDPRTKLRIINVPSERRVAFAGLQDMIIHVFLDCYKITSSDQYADRVFIVTDQTLYVCTREGAVSRCFMVDRIKQLDICLDTKALGIEVPTEYDVLVKFSSAVERDRVIKVLRTVYRRLTRDRLPVQMTSTSRKFDPSNFKLKKPPNFRLTIIPQHPVSRLREYLERFEQDEEAMVEELQLIQDEMEARHVAKMKDMQSLIEDGVLKLKGLVQEAWENEAKLKRLREDVAKGRRTIEQVDGAFTVEGELPLSKDSQIAELELVVARLNAAVYAAGGDDRRRHGLTGVTGDYFQKDLASDLYNPVWPGVAVAAAGSSGGNAASSAAAGGPGMPTGLADLTTVAQMLQQKIVDIDDEVKKANEVRDNGIALETKLRLVEERIAYLRHVQRTAAFRNETSGTGGGGGGGSSGMMMNGSNGGNASSSSPRSIAGQQNNAGTDDSYAWLADLPSEITTETITVDPRTGLHFVDIPDVMRPYFSDAVNAVIHFFAVVRKPSKMGDLVKRVVMIGDGALYLCTPNGIVKRCLDVADISEILVDATLGIGFRCQGNYDLAFQCVSGDHRQEIIDILRRIFRVVSGGRTIPVVPIARHQRLDALLKLSAPQNYVMRMTPFRSKQELVEAIREKRDVIIHNAPSSLSLGAGAQKPAGLNMTEQQYLRLRNDVARQMDYEWRQDAALVRLRSQMDALDKQLRVVNEEAHGLKQQIDQHRCEDGILLNAGSFPLPAGRGILPSSGAGIFRPNADGCFFVTSDPLVFNCDLDVLRITMDQQKNIFTGHNNGFIHHYTVEGQTHTLRRTMRCHTGRIHSLSCHGSQLMSASADGTVRLFDLKQKDPVVALCAHHGAVLCAHREGSKAISGGNDSIIQQWDLDRGVPTTTLKGHHGPVVALKFQGDLMVSAEWGWAVFWDLRTNKIIRSLRDSQGGIRALDFVDGIAVAGGTGGDLTVWDVAHGSGDTIAGHEDDVLCVQIMGKSAVTSGGDLKIRMWDISAMKSLGVFHDSHPYEVPSFMVQGKRFLAAQGPFAMLWQK